jgi:hypothetical protein
MPYQDHVTSWTRHEQAVVGLCHGLKAAGLKEEPGLARGLPEFAFARAPFRSFVPSRGLVPRDLVARLDGEPFSVKVYQSDGTIHSSLYRAVAYTLLATNGPYLQVVADAPPLPLPWLAALQPPLDMASPGGIHGQKAFLKAVAAVTADRTPNQNNP